MSFCTGFKDQYSNWWLAFFDSVDFFSSRGFSYDLVPPSGAEIDLRNFKQGNLMSILHFGWLQCTDSMQFPFTLTVFTPDDVETWNTKSQRFQRKNLPGPIWVFGHITLLKTKKLTRCLNSAILLPPFKKTQQTLVSRPLFPVTTQHTCRCRPQFPSVICPKLFKKGEFEKSSS